MIESKYGLIFPGAELLLNSYCLPPQDGGTDSSGKRRLPKEATTSYVSGEPNAAVRMLNPSAHTELTAVSEKIHINDFPVTIERMKTFMDTLFKALMGSSCLDGKGGGPVMSPLNADEKEMHVAAFRLWVDTTIEVYLKPTRGGKGHGELPNRATRSVTLLHHFEGVPSLDNAQHALPGPGPRNELGSGQASQRRSSQQSGEGRERGHRAADGAANFRICLPDVPSAWGHGSVLW
jgi:hypothetical protein